MKHFGRRNWIIAEGYIPEYSTGSEPEFTSHETACILNTGDEPAKINITIFFKDKEPVGPYTLKVEARRTYHLRFNDLKDPEPLPLATDYSSVFESDVPVIIQHTRLDSRKAENALMSTLAYGE
tara:strand:+ start:722 stop:1093 length:372 start_codon:yes stop_codon:yes gene_type:complete